MVRHSPIGSFDLDGLPRAERTRLMLTAACGEGVVAELPAVAVVGERPGPTLLAVAGVHGDEYEGMEAIRLVAGAVDPALLGGRFLGVIVANPFAYRSRTRATSPEVDGLNLARVFPGDPGGRPTERLAAALLDLVRRTLTPEDLFLDFHSGSADVPFAPLIGVRDVLGPARASAEEAARRFGLPNLWLIPDGVGPFNAEVARLGIPTLGTETTGRAGCDAADVEGFRRGLENLLLHLGMLPGEPPTRVDGPLRATVDVAAPAEGFLRSGLRVGDEIDAGQPVGTIVDVYGDPLAELVAPVGGTVWAARTMPAVRSGELCLMIARREAEPQ